MAARARGDRRRWPAAVLGRNPGPCFRIRPGIVLVGVASTFVMGFGTAVTVAAIATLAVGAGSLARKLATARDGVGALAMRGIEVAASILIVAFGVLLLTGYMANERLFGG
jgi:nickel/cobalt exporter